MYCGVAGFLLSGEMVILDELSQVAIPKELLSKLLLSKAAVPGDEIIWEIDPDPKDIKKYVGNSKLNICVKIFLKVINGDYVVVKANWRNKD